MRALRQLSGTAVRVYSAGIIWMYAARIDAVTQLIVIIAITTLRAGDIF